MATDLSKAELEKNIKEIIKDGDLATLTSKKVRQILEQKYGTTLKERKKEIDDIVMALVDEQSDEESSSPKRMSNTSESEQSSPSKKQKVSQKVSVIVPSKKKKIDDSDSEEVESDDEDDDEGEDYDEKPKKRSTTKRKTAKSPEKKPKAKKSSGEQSDKPKRKSGFSMPMLLSAELAELMGETHMARPEIVKKMWQYVREKNLRDPSNGRYTICDEPLEAIIGQKRFLTFSMMKYLNKHVKDPSLCT